MSWKEEGGGAERVKSLHVIGDVLCAGGRGHNVLEGLFKKYIFQTDNYEMK